MAEKQKPGDKKARPNGDRKEAPAGKPRGTREPMTDRLDGKPLVTEQFVDECNHALMTGEISPSVRQFMDLMKDFGSDYDRDMSPDFQDEREPTRLEQLTNSIARAVSNLFSPGWYAGVVMASLGRFTNWLTRDLKKVFSRNPWKRETYVAENRDGTIEPRKHLPNIVRGLGNFIIKSYFVLAIVGYMASRPPTSGFNWINPVHLLGRATATPVAEYINNGKSASVKPNRSFWKKAITPWTWLMPYESKQLPKLVISDHPSNPKTLASRSASYYENTFGVTKNHDWLRANPDVLRFFQERVDGYRVASVKRHTQTPATCTRRFRLKSGSKKRLRLPRTCTAKPFGIKTINDLMSWTYGTKSEGWKLGNRVCCTLSMQTTTAGLKGRNLRLNRAKANAAVDHLKSLEKKGVKVDYAYLTSPTSMHRWTEMELLTLQ